MQFEAVNNLESCLLVDAWTLFILCRREDGGVAMIQYYPKTCLYSPSQQYNSISWQTKSAFRLSKDQVETHFQQNFVLPA